MGTEETSIMELYTISDEANKYWRYRRNYTHVHIEEYFTASKTNL